MNREQARKLIVGVFESSFDKNRYENFLRNLLKSYNDKIFTYNNNFIPEAFRESIQSLERIGKYVYDDKEIDLLIVTLERETSLERARTLQRNFIAWYLKGSRGGRLKDAGLVAFVSPSSEDWRFSLVKMDYKFDTTSSGRIKIKEEFTPARRFSFLVGKNEKSHTAQTRFIPILENDEKKPTLEDLENAFNIETVTEEFFKKYRDLFIKLKKELDKIVEIDECVKEEFQRKNINTVDFAKKLLGQIVFLYFMQKKGWFGVPKGQNWGTGPKDFMRRLFNKEYGDYRNFFNDLLEPLFYEALRTDRSNCDHYYSRFNCKIPFLNGGLFDPINDYDWVNTEILIPNSLFSNENRTQEGDIGDGIFDIFDRYNFTVNEEEPLEKEVALDPELLGKIYEKLNAIREDNFDEYLSKLKSGKRSDESEFNREYGVYYTPRDIVHYMCKESLIEYLHTNTSDLGISREDIEIFVRHSNLILEHERTALEKRKAIQNGKIKETKYEHKVPESIIQNAKRLDDLLKNIKVCDPAVGSGAFLVGMMHEIVNLRELLNVYINGTDKDVHPTENISKYELKRHCIENSLYGVDIDPGAIETCKLRFWLSLVVDEEDFKNIKPLPNLDYKVVCGDSLLCIEKDLLNFNNLRTLEELKRQYFNETNPSNKLKYKERIEALIREITQNHNQFDFHVYFSEVFHQDSGFDIVIANPPYISTKGVKEDYKKQLLKFYGFADDTYNHFFFKGIKILKPGGVLTYISSKTFWTIQTKRNLRELLLKNTICQFFDTANPFESAMVDTCITIVQKKSPSDTHKIVFLDGRKDIYQPVCYSISQCDYANAPNKVFFIPTDYNKRIYERFGKKVKELLDQWWDKISTSKNIEKHKEELENYRKSLKPGDITLLGLITEGGQGLATGNNGKFIGVLEGTKWAEKVREERPKKLWDFIQLKEPLELKHLKSKSEVVEYLNRLSEKEIRRLFDGLKERYGRDIFGQGWLYRIVSKDEVANVDELTEDEKLNGINGLKTFVPYDKGDKEGNRWYAPTPYYIDWSRENVKFLKENSGKKGEGMPVVRNPQFYFREGFCWNNVLSDETIKCRIKEKSVHSTEAMTLISLIPNLITDRYLVCLLNSTFLGNYRMYFINVSHHLTTGDAKEFPIIIPTIMELKQFEDIFNRAYNVQKLKFEGRIIGNDAELQLKKIQKELDEMIEKMYLGAQL